MSALPKSFFSDEAAAFPLGNAPYGFKGLIQQICCPNGSSGLSKDEIESRLLELGFVEGANIEILHQGSFRKDPIAVRVNNATIALRRRDAMAILVG